MAAFLNLHKSVRLRWSSALELQRGYMANLWFTVPIFAIKKTIISNSDVCTTSPGLLFACAAALAFFPTLFLSVSFLPSAVFFLAGAAFEICNFVLGSVG